MYYYTAPCLPQFFCFVFPLDFIWKFKMIKWDWWGFISCCCPDNVDHHFLIKKFHSLIVGIWQMTTYLIISSVSYILRWEKQLKHYQKKTNRTQYTYINSIFISNNDNATGENRQGRCISLMFIIAVRCVLNHLSMAYGAPRCVL